MTFAGIIYAEQLWVLSEVLERHCDAANIKPGTPEYESEGVRIVALYENGARTLYALLAGLNGPILGRQSRNPRGPEEGEIARRALPEAHRFVGLGDSGYS